MSGLLFSIRSDLNLTKNESMKVIKTFALALLLSIGLAVSQGMAAPETLEIQAPVPNEVEVPSVPTEFRGLNIPGSVTVLFRVDETGIVRDLKVEDSSHPEYAESVVNAVRTWRFYPAEKNGVPVARTVRLPFKFVPADN